MLNISWQQHPDHAHENPIRRELSENVLLASYQFETITCTSLVQTGAGSNGNSKTIDVLVRLCGQAIILVAPRMKIVSSHLLLMPTTSYLPGAGVSFSPIGTYHIASSLLHYDLRIS